jgi:hypothetical protein
VNLNSNNQQNYTLIGTTETKKKGPVAPAASGNPESNKFY